MKLLVLTASLYALTTQAFIIPEREAKTVLSREKRWGKSPEEKTKARNRKLDRRLNEKCVVNTCQMEEWAEVSENYEADGYDSETLRSPIKKDLFQSQYTECVGGARNQSDKVKKLRNGCLDAVKNLYNQWPTTTAAPTTTAEPTTEEPTTTAEPTTTTAEPTTAEPTTAEPTTVVTTAEPTTTTEATTQEETTTKEATTTEEPTTEKATTTEKEDSFTDAWATTTRKQRRRKNKNRG